MSKQRTFKPDMKARVVLQVLTGAKSAAQVCREQHLNQNVLTRWKKQFIDNASLIFKQESDRSDQAERVAELERLVGKLTMELEISKKASQLLSLPSKRNGRS